MNYKNLLSIPLFLLLALMASCTGARRVGEVKYNANKLTPEIRALATEIAADGYIGTEYMGRLPQTAPAYTRRLLLMRKATTNELHNLTLHPSPLVQLVAFEGLYLRDDPGVPEILGNFKSRTDYIQYIRGDISEQIPFLAYAYTYVMRYPTAAVPEHLAEEPPRYTLPDALRAEVEQQLAALLNTGGNTR